MPNLEDIVISSFVNLVKHYRSGDSAGLVFTRDSNRQ